LDCKEKDGRLEQRSIRWNRARFHLIEHKLL